MADGKKSFVLYCDIIHTVSLLDNEDAGLLFKHILEYVNDQSPETSNKIIQLAFEPIKQQLKRDLKKWEHYIEKQRENGLKGGRPTVKSETQKTQALKRKPKKADNVNVSVSVNDNVNVSKNTVIPDESFLLELPELKINTAIEYLSRTQKAQADRPLVLSLWTVFKEKNFTGEKIYKSEADIFRHFFETLKFEKLNGSKTFANSDKQRGAKQLVEILRQDYAARGKENPGT